MNRFLIRCGTLYLHFLLCTGIMSVWNSCWPSELMHYVTVSVVNVCIRLCLEGTVFLTIFHHLTNRILNFAGRSLIKHPFRAESYKVSHFLYIVQLENL